MSAWTELACLLSSIFLVSSIDAKSVFLPISFQEKTLLMSAWIELACLLGSIFLVSSIGVCLKCFPPLVCQCLSSGSLGFLLRRASLLPSVSQQSYLSGCFLSF